MRWCTDGLPCGFRPATGGKDMAAVYGVTLPTTTTSRTSTSITSTQTSNSTSPRTTATTTTTSPANSSESPEQSNNATGTSENSQPTSSASTALSSTSLITIVVVCLVLVVAMVLCAILFYSIRRNRRRMAARRNHTRAVLEKQNTLERERVLTYDAPPRPRTPTRVRFDDGSENPYPHYSLYSNNPESLVNPPNAPPTPPIPAPAMIETRHLQTPSPAPPLGMRMPSPAPQPPYPQQHPFTQIDPYPTRMYAPSAASDITTTVKDSEPMLTIDRIQRAISPTPQIPNPPRSPLPPLPYPTPTPQTNNFLIAQSPQNPAYLPSSTSATPTRHSDAYSTPSNGRYSYVPTTTPTSLSRTRSRHSSITTSMIESALVGGVPLQRGSGLFNPQTGINLPYPASSVDSDSIGRSTVTPNRMHMHSHDAVGGGALVGGKGTLTGVFGIVNRSFDGEGEGEIGLGSGNTVVALEVYSDGYGFGLNQKTGAMGYFPLGHVTFPTTPENPDGIMVEVEVNQDAAETLGM
ncbi:hypothetical protein HDV00_010001 [Rhizophlyctis rosea]|nr:hypothetical protein HDV00_010001 [Rhizophlyctis rosea]